MKMVRISDIPSSEPTVDEMLKLQRFFHTFYNGYSLSTERWNRERSLLKFAMDPFKVFSFSLLKVQNQATTLLGNLETILEIQSKIPLLQSNQGTLKVTISQKFTAEQHQRFNELIFALNITHFYLEGWGLGDSTRTEYPLITASPRLTFIKTLIDAKCKKSNYLEHLFEANPNLKNWITYCQDDENYFPDSLCRHKCIEDIHLSAAHTHIKDFKKFLDLNRSLKTFSSETVFMDQDKTFTMRHSNNVLETIKIFHPTQPLIKFLGDNIKLLPGLRVIETIPHYPIDFDDPLIWGYLFGKLIKPMKVTMVDAYSSKDPKNGPPNPAADQMNKHMTMIKSMANGMGRSLPDYCSGTPHTTAFIKANHKFVLDFETNQPFDINLMKSNKSIEILTLIEIENWKYPQELVKIITYSKSLKVLSLVSDDEKLLKSIKKNLDVTYKSTYNVKSNTLKEREYKRLTSHSTGKQNYILTINIR